MIIINSNWRSPSSSGAIHNLLFRFKSFAKQDRCSLVQYLGKSTQRPASYCEVISGFVLSPKRELLHYCLEPFKYCTKENKPLSRSCVIIINSNCSGQAKQYPALACQFANTQSTEHECWTRKLTLLEPRIIKRWTGCANHSFGNVALGS